MNRLINRIAYYATLVFGGIFGTGIVLMIFGDPHRAINPVYIGGMGIGCASLIYLSSSKK